MGHSKSPIEDDMTDIVQKKNATFYPDALVENGFTPVANVLFYRRAALGISSNVLLLLVALLQHVRKKRLDIVKVPASRLCADTGFSKSTIHRTSKEAEVLGLVRVSRRENQVNEYDLQPLIEKLLGAIRAPSGTRHEEELADRAPEKPALTGTSPLALDPRMLLAREHLRAMAEKGFHHQIPEEMVATLKNHQAPRELKLRAVEAAEAAVARFKAQCIEKSLSIAADGPAANEPMTPKMTA